MPLEELQYYLDTVIPHLESELKSDLSDSDMIDTYQLYVDVLRLVAYYDFPTFNKYLELDEDHEQDNRAFYHHREVHLEEVFQSLNDMEIHDLYDRLLIMMPPRVGKTTSGIRFLAWIIGRHPENTQFATSYSDNVTSSFYSGVLEVVMNERFLEVFEDAPLIKQNAKREEIWLKVDRRYPSILFVPVGGSMTGRAEAGQYLYCDDLVSGLEEALSLTRLEKLWGTYSVNVRQRKKDGCKEIHVATPWSVHDPISKLAEAFKDDPRTKIIRMSCYDEDGESTFDFKGGFSTAYYNDLQDGMDEASFSALYLQDPIEREGLLYHDDELQYYFELPNEREDTVIAVCDSKNLGKDHVASPVGYVYGEKIFVDDIVYNDGLPDVTRPAVANLWLAHDVVRGDVELNNGGNYYAEDLNKLIHDGGGKTSVRMFFSSNNKNTKIITYSDFIKSNFVFRDKSTYHPRSDYANFMKDVFRWTQSGKNAFDDAPDALAMLAQLYQDLTGMSVKILDRRKLGL